MFAQLKIKPSSRYSPAYEKSGKKNDGSLPIQRKLSIGGDEIQQEREPENTARVTDISVPSFIQRKYAEGGKEERTQQKPLSIPFIQTKSEASKWCN